MSKTNDWVINEMNHQQELAEAGYPKLAIIAKSLTAQGIVQPVLDGTLNPIIGLEQIVHLSKVLEEAKKMIEDLAVSEAEKYGKGESLPTVLGYSISLKSGRRIYSYKDITILTAKQRLKEMEECAKNGTVTADGELLDKPEVTYTKDILSFSKIK